MTRFRPATDGDGPAVGALERVALGADAWSEASVREELTGPSRQAWVAEDAAGQVVGYVVVLGAGDVADLQRIAVDPAHRRQGVAGALLDACDLTSYARMMLEVRADNGPALSFYRARGFVEVARRRRYYADGCDAVVMQTGLSGPPAGILRA